MLHKIRGRQGLKMRQTRIVVESAGIATKSMRSLRPGPGCIVILHPKV